VCLRQNLVGKWRFQHCATQPPVLVVVTWAPLSSQCGCPSACHCHVLEHTKDMPPYPSIATSGFYATNARNPRFDYKYGYWATFWSFYCSSHKGLVFSQAPLVRISSPLQGRKPRVDTMYTRRTRDDRTAPVLADVSSKQGVWCMFWLSILAHGGFRASSSRQCAACLLACSTVCYIQLGVPPRL